MNKMSYDMKFIILSLITITVMLVFMYFGASQTNHNNQSDEIIIVEISEPHDIIIGQCRKM